MQKQIQMLIQEFKRSIIYKDMQGAQMKILITLSLTKTEYVHIG